MQITGKTRTQKEGFINCYAFSSFLLLMFQCFPYLLISWYKTSKTQYNMPEHPIAGGNKNTPSLLTCFRSKRVLASLTFLYRDTLQELLCKNSSSLLFYFYLCFSLCILKTWCLSTYHSHLKENEVSRYCQNSNGKRSLYKFSLKLVEQCMYLVVMRSH